MHILFVDRIIIKTYKVLGEFLEVCVCVWGGGVGVGGGGGGGVGGGGGGGGSLRTQCVVMRMSPFLWCTFMNHVVFD